MFERIKVSQVNEHVYRMDDAGKATGYLVVGKDKAAVIDTMNGYENVKEVVRTITELPLMVINTHGHGDHVLGNVYFEEAYLHPDDMPLVEELCRNPQLIEILKQHNLHMSKFHPLNGGVSIDLGGLHLETIHIPGHTPGGLLILLKEDGILFTGDAINRHLWLQLNESLSVKETADAIERVLYLKEQASIILHGHSTGEEPITLMDDLLRGLRELENGQTAEDLPYHWFGGEDKKHLFAPDSVICYREK